MTGLFAATNGKITKFIRSGHERNSLAHSGSDGRQQENKPNADSKTQTSRMKAQTSV